MTKSSIFIAVSVGMVVMAMVSANDENIHALTDAGRFQPQERIPDLPDHDGRRQKRQACGSPTLLTPAQQAEALNVHNVDRSNEPSSNEFLMTWDVNLAARAQEKASQCLWLHDTLTDCSNNPIGQNLYMTYSSSGRFPAVNMTAVIQSWYAERQYWNYTSSTCQPNKVCGHFTQMVWATTTAVGCGYFNCPTVYVPGKTNITNATYVVCDYSPPGNVVGSQPFTMGTACSNCASVTRAATTNRGYTCSNIYGLCSACDPVSDPINCQCGTPGSCSGTSTWQTSTCTCQ